MTNWLLSSSSGALGSNLVICEKDVLYGLPLAAAPIGWFPLRKGSRSTMVYRSDTGQFGSACHFQPELGLVRPRVQERSVDSCALTC